MTREQIDELRRVLYNAKYTTDAEDENPFVGIYFQDLLGIIANYDNNPNWISVKDKLPPHDTEYEGRRSVDCYITDGVDVEISYYNYYNNTWDDVRLSGKVTHWYIPQPPRKEANNE